MVAGQEIQAHQIVLRARCEYLCVAFACCVFHRVNGSEGLLRNPMREQKESRLVLEDVAERPFRWLLYFLYTDEMHKDVKSIEDLHSLLLLADRFQLPVLVSMCSSRLYDLLTPENAFDMLILAERFPPFKVALLPSHSNPLSLFCRKVCSTTFICVETTWPPCWCVRFCLVRSRLRVDCLCVCVCDR